jgi:hypothetical protein
VSSWDAEKAYTLAVQTLNYLEKVYPKGVSLEPLESYRRAVLEAQDQENFVAFKESLRGMMREGQRVALEARQSRGAA